MRRSVWCQLAAEATGTALLLMAVVGSGIMAQTLAEDQPALVLLGNTLPTAAILVVAIMSFGPVSGAHLNPAVTLVFYLRHELTATNATQYMLAQISGACIGVLLAHGMFEWPLLSEYSCERAGFGQLLSETVATFGLVTAILGTIRYGTVGVAAAVGLYIMAAYWFTASTSFANPAVTLARGMTGSFSGIRWDDIPGFILAQGFGAVAAHALVSHILHGASTTPDSQ